MKIKNYSVTPFWDKSVLDAKTKQSRVMLTINLHRKQFRLTLKIRCTKAEFDAAVNTRSFNAKELRKDLNDYVVKAEMILERLINPTKESFTRMFKSETDLFAFNKTDAFYFFGMKSDMLKKEGRISTAGYFHQCEKNLKVFKPRLFLEEIDTTFLKQYQAYLLKRGNSISTISTRLRALRVIFNLAIRRIHIRKTLSV